MSDYALTQHAQLRMQQRGLQIKDVELIRDFGTPINVGYLLRKKDIQVFEANTKRIIQRLYELTDAAVIEIEGTVVSAYRPTKKKRRKMQRR